MSETVRECTHCVDDPDIDQPFVCEDPGAMNEHVAEAHAEVV